MRGDCNLPSRVGTGTCIRRSPLLLRHPSTAFGSRPGRLPEAVFTDGFAYFSHRAWRSRSFSASFTRCSGLSVPWTSSAESAASCAS